MATVTPKTGYQIEVVTMKCFLEMLSSSEWYNLAVRTGGSDPAQIAAALAGFALLAAQQVEVVIKANETVY